MNPDHEKRLNAMRLRQLNMGHVRHNTRPRPCACHCGKMIPAGKPAQQRYLNSAHRYRHQGIEGKRGPKKKRYVAPPKVEPPRLPILDVDYENRPL